MNNPPAFPATAGLGDRVRVYKGMTLRDYFAAKAMQGFSTTLATVKSPNWKLLAEDAYLLADAMMKAREQ